MIYIDKYAYFSALKDVNPLVKILFGGLSLIACVCSVNVLAFGIVFVTMFYMTVFKAKIPLSYYIKLLLLPLGFMIFGVVGVVVNVAWLPRPLDCLWYMNVCNLNIYVSKSGLPTAATLVCKSMSAVSCLYFIILTTPFRDVVHFLYLLKCPKVLVTLSVLIYQFIFLLMDTADIKLKSQLCRGGYRGFKGFARTFSMLWGSVFIQAWLKSRWAFKSMQSRGYDGQLKLMPQQFLIDRKEIVLLSLFFLVVMAPNFIPKPVEFSVQPPVYSPSSVVSGGQSPESSASGNFNGFQYIGFHR